MTLMWLNKKDPLYCRNPNDIGHKLIMDFVTWWNSTLSNLERLIEQMSYITAVANVISISMSAEVTSQLSHNCLLLNRPWQKILCKDK